MKSRSLLLVLSATLEPAVLASPTPALGHTVYVATNGSDHWLGRLPAPNRTRSDGPFATLARARDAVREAKGRADGGPGPVTVAVRRGTYYLREPVVFTPADSGTAEYPITYKAYPGEKPVLSGGRPAAGWKRYRGQIWCCSVRSLDLTDAPVRHLFFRGVHQHLARYPNFDPRDPLRGGWMFTRPPAGYGQVIQWICHAPDWVEYQVDFPAAGDYRLWTRYAGHPGVARLALLVDGRPACTLDLPTEDYLKLAWSPAVAALRVTAGRHVIRFVARGHHDGFYQDCWVFSDDPGHTPSEGKAATGTHIVRVEAESFTRKESRRMPPPGDFRDTLEIGVNPTPSSLAPRDTVSLTVRKGWDDAREAEIVIFQPAADWLTNVLPIARADEETGNVILGSKSLCDLPWGRRCYVRNVFEELDAPGEWYLDPTKATLYFWPPPGQKPGDGEVVIGALDRLLELRGNAAANQFVSHLRFDGLTFRHTAARELGGVEYPGDAGLRLVAARRCVIARCGLIDLAANAVLLDSSSREISIEGCEISGAGACGILQPPAPDNPPGPIFTGHRIVGNDFHHCSQLHKGTGAVELYCGGNLIEHNSMHDLPRWCVALPYNRGGRNVVRFNEMRRTCLETGDCGPIHTSGWDTGGEIAYNLIVDAPGMVGDGGGHLKSPWFAWGVYLDGYSTGYHVHHNVVTGTAWGGFMTWEAQGNVFENNVFVEKNTYQGFYIPLDANLAGTRVVRNIFYYAGRDEGQRRLPGRWNLRAKNAEVDWNVLFYQRSPVSGQNITGVQPRWDWWSDWRAQGTDAHSIIAAPLFSNPQKGDFRLRPGSPALKLGFEPFDLSTVGLRGYRQGVH